DRAKPRGIGAAGSKRGVGDEQDPAVEGERCTQLPLRQRLDVERQSPECCPVAPGVLQQALILAEPDVPPVAAQPLVKDDPGDLASLARAGAVAEEVAAAVARS